MGGGVNILVVKLWISVFLLASHHSSSFYLPGVAPQDFSLGDELRVKVIKLTSTKTPLSSSYYSLPYCRPPHIADTAQNLAEILRVLLGDRVENSPYVFKMREPQLCKIVCRLVLTQETAKELKKKIDDEYRVNMILDNLPLVVPIGWSDQEHSSIVYQQGFHVGFKEVSAGTKDEKHFIHNHLAFTVKYHRDANNADSARIVGFEGRPYSVKHEYYEEWRGDNTRRTTCNPHAKRIVTNSKSPQQVEDRQEIIFTYDVEFQESDVQRASLLDTHLQ